ncbi:Protein nlp7 [Datura stramonium]|uniref:Protein nlp7 n=1 Tax=Datura stramonium TaxID=4076 RepID=A0ABS8SUS7_DATST|nr:Protein nlp7 [Datura stramonium]
MDFPALSVSPATLDLSLINFGDLEATTETVSVNADKIDFLHPFLGLTPGDYPDGSCRVFRLKLPEWTPNVQYYSSKEFPRLDHALHYNVRGTLALPVFEPSGQSCVGVLELIMTSQKINYAAKVDKVYQALKAVNLKSSNIGPPKHSGICDGTWVPCRHRSVLADGGGLRKSCSSFDGSCMGQICMSTTDVSFYVVDARMWGFREACVEHHLQKDRGVAGRAYASRNHAFVKIYPEFLQN